MSGDSHNFSGLLLERPNKAIQRSDLTGVAEFRFGGTIGKSAWETYTFVSPVPLYGEEPRLSRPPFQYPLVCRRSGTRILALSLNRDIVEHLLEENFYGALGRLKRVSIGVDQLVKSIATKPTDYALSFAHARVPAFGTSLRSISYYGDDLAEAALFRDQLALMVFFTCGLKRANAKNEIVRLGSDGQVSFFLTRPQKVLEVEKALSFLREEGYLLSDLWGEE